MKTVRRKKIITVILLLVIIVAIKIVSLFPAFIERYYSSGIYLYISKTYRLLFGWLPFSLGDVVYFGAAVYLIYNTFKLIRALVKGTLRWPKLRIVLFKAFCLASCIYIWFNLSWGLNYNRPGIAYQLQLNAGIYSVEDLKQITGLLLRKVNERRVTLDSNEMERQFSSETNIFRQAEASYRSTAGTFPFLHYAIPSVKRSLYGRLGNLLGFLGYYNPFTGEAQLNPTMPKFILPYVSCHEIAHQMGYASESEASFVGYLAAARSKEPIFHYSAYFDLFNYANGELYSRDSITAKNNYRQLDTLVKKDVTELREYWRQSDNVIEPLVKIFYDNYLKANQQAHGLQSYNEVTGWLIAYYKKYGTI